MGGIETAGEKGFRTLYDKHRDAVLAYCMRRADRTGALDAVAETFAIAWRRRDDFPTDDGALRWLYVTAHQVLANQRRTSRRFRRLLTKLDRTDSVSREPGPAEVVVRAERDQELLAALSRLQPADQEILRLVTWEELPRDEVAALLAISRSALDQRLYRAVTRLRKEFARSGHLEVTAHQPIEGSAV